MSEDYLVWQAAPTLAGLKTGSLFPCKYESYDKLKEEIRVVNQTLVKKGLRLIPLRRNDKQALLYLYRPEPICQRRRQQTFSVGKATATCVWSAACRS